MWHVRLRTAVLALSLSSRFALASAAVLVAGALVLGTWMTKEMESGVLRRAAADSALYVEALLEPHVQALAAGDLTDAQRAELARTIARAIDRHVAAVKVWRRDGTVAYANRSELIGTTSDSPSLRRALSGSVVSEISDLHEDENIFERTLATTLIETYIPLRGGTDQVLAVAEFYQYTDVLDAELGSARFSTWLIIAVATAAMYLILAGMVRAGSNTIERQRGALETMISELFATTDRLRVVSAARAETDEAVLRRVARELHDGIAQDLAAALFQLDQRASAAALDRARAAVDSALNEVRSLARGLALPDLATVPLADVVEQACLDHERKTGRMATRKLGPLPERAPMPVKIAVYRVLQEALSNTFRHTRDAGVEIRAWTEDGRLHLECSDDGPGLPVSPTEGLGLRGMRERVVLLGGALALGRGEKGGTLVSVTLPLPS